MQCNNWESQEGEITVFIKWLEEVYFDDDKQAEFARGEKQLRVC